MPINIRFGPGPFENAYREAMGRRLFAAAVFFANHHQRLVGVPNPSPFTNPSVPGEYPKKRTGFGQKSVVIVPTNPDEIKRRLSIRVGYAKAAFYMSYLNVVRGRLGFPDTLDTLRGELATILGKSASGGFRL